MRILIVDDDQLTAELTAECLAMDADVSAHIAIDGASAVSLVAQIAPDVVLLDVELPDVSGLELASALKDISPNADMRIIILSGNVRDDGMSNNPPGVSAWLEKPVHIDVLQKCITRACEFS